MKNNDGLREAMNKALVVHASAIVKEYGLTLLEPVITSAPLGDLENMRYTNAKHSSGMTFEVGVVLRRTVSIDGPSRLFFIGKPVQIQTSKGIFYLYVVSSACFYENATVPEVEAFLNVPREQKPFKARPNNKEKNTAQTNEKGNNHANSKLPGN